MAEKKDCDVIFELGCLVVEKDKIIKQLREENDTLKTEIMAIKSGSDVLKIVKLEEENAELKKYINQLDREQKSIDEFATAVHEEYKREITELKRLLRLAVEELEPAICNYCKYENEEQCEKERRLLGIENDACAFVCWKHAEEALELIGGDK